MVADVMRAFQLSTYTSWVGMLGVAASVAHERDFPIMAREDRMRRKLHSHAMVISSNAQTTNNSNSNGYIRPSFALADSQCDWMEVEIIQ